MCLFCIMRLIKGHLLLSFCCALFFVSNGIYAQFNNLKFETYSTLEGLSSSTCTEIFQDSEGNVWFGTIDGLNRYDGYSFEVYRPILNDPNSISNNRINSIVEDGKANNGFAIHIQRVK